MGQQEKKKVRKIFPVINSKLSLISSYLLDCKQKVCLHGVCSSHSELRAGLPKGSLLGPLLFIIFINELCSPGHVFEIIR